MNIIRRRGWEIPESQLTPEHLAFNRRKLLIGGAAAMALSPVALSPVAAQAQRVTDVATLPDPTADLYPAKLNAKYKLDRPITDEKVNGNYNNFYEFGEQKTIASTAQALNTRPWTIKIDGMVEKPFEIGIDDLIRKMGIEERTYRHRCVEAWSMAIAWSYKSVKSINHFTVTDKQPKTYWEALQASEYGFWANVNPAVPHPRWSQADEEIIGTGERKPTLLFNGYGEFVADIYKGLEKERLWA